MLTIAIGGSLGPCSHIRFVSVRMLFVPRSAGFIGWGVPGASHSYGFAGNGSATSEIWSSCNSHCFSE